MDLSAGERELRNWLLEWAPVKSGTCGRRYLRFGTYQEAYQKYAADENRQRHYKKSKFRGFCKYYAIRPMPFDKYHCPLCWGHSDDYTNEERQEHRQCVDTQFAAYRHHRDGLKCDEALLLIDFSKFHETAKFKLSDLGIVTVLRNSKGELYEEIFDAVAVNVRQDGNYVAQALTRWVRQFQFRRSNKQVIRRLYIWSDGGFKSYSVMAAFGELCDLLKKNSATAEWNFFPPYHGHSRADAHFGRVKKAVRVKYADTVIEKPQHILDVLRSHNPTGVSELGQIPVVFEEVQPDRPWIDSTFRVTYNQARNQYHAFGSSAQGVKSQIRMLYAN